MLFSACNPVGSAPSTAGVSSKKESGVVSNTKRKPKLNSHRLLRQICPLSREQLERHLRHHAGTQDIEKQQARIIQVIQTDLWSVSLNQTACGNLEILSGVQAVA